MYAGDARNSLENLRRELRRLKYPNSLDYAALIRGQQDDFIAIYRYLFTDFSQSLTKYLSDQGYDLTGMPDKKFMESVYRCLRDVLNFKPQITITQFFSSGFAERKMDMLVSVCQGLQYQNDRLSKSVNQKSFQSRVPLMTSALNNSSSRHLKENEPEIIEIRHHTSRPLSGSAGKSSVKLSKRNRLNTVNRPEAAVNVPRPIINQEYAVNKELPQMHRNDSTIPLNNIEASLPQKYSQETIATQTFSDSQSQILENISGKLDNMFARITLLESRMALLENKLPDAPATEIDSRCNSFPSPPIVDCLPSRKGVNGCDSSDIVPSQPRIPVEAIVINQTSHTPPPVKFRFYDGEATTKNEISQPMKLQGTQYLTEARGQYSPSPYRLNSVGHDKNFVDVPSDEECDSDITSEESNDGCDLNPRLTENGSSRTVDNEDHPVRLKDTELRASNDAPETFESQISRIQEMIECTTKMLNRT